MRIAFVLLAPVLFAAAACATEWVYDRHLTLSLEVARAQGENGPVTRVDASAYLPLAVVERWTDESASAPGETGGTRGYRVRITLTRDGQRIAPTRVTPGTGPLADWLGVFAIQIGRQLVWRRCALIRVVYHIPLNSPQATYQLTWIVDCRPARVETLTLPLLPAAETLGQSGGLHSRNGLGVYPLGTELGAAYPFTFAEPGADFVVHGTGLVVAALAPEQAAVALSLERPPALPVLVGWQADGGAALSCLFSESDALAPRSLSLPPPQELRPGYRAEPTAPTSYRLQDADTGKAFGSLAAAPGAAFQRTAEGAALVERGLVRVSVIEGEMRLSLPNTEATVSGLALVEVDADETRVWCVAGRAMVGGRAVAARQVARLVEGGLALEPFGFSDIAQLFLRTALVVPPPVVQGAGPSAPTVRQVHGVVCRGVGGNNQPVGVGSQFPAGVEQLTLLVEHRLPPEPERTLGIVLYEGERVRARHRMGVAGSGKLALELIPRPGGFRSGAWRIEIALDDTLQQDLHFTVGE